MKKLITSLTLIFLISACTFSMDELLSELNTPTATPTLRPPTETSVYTNTPTITPTSPTPTFTPTPTVLGGLPIELSNGTVVTATHNIALYTPLPIFGDLTGTGFERIQLSDRNMYYGVCKPNKVRFTVQVSDVANTYYVLVFVRTQEKGTDEGSPWNKGHFMDPDPGGYGIYKFWLGYKSVPEYHYYINAWVEYQFVAIDWDNKEIGRSPVYDKFLTIRPCMTR